MVYTSGTDDTNSPIGICHWAYNTAICPLAAALNVYLLWLITYKSTKHMIAYKKVLYYGAIEDLFMAIFNWFVIYDGRLLDSWYVIYVSGILGPWQGRATFILGLAHLIFCFFSVACVTIQYIYRYLYLMHGVTMSVYMIVGTFLLFMVPLVAAMGSTVFPLIDKQQEFHDIMQVTNHTKFVHTEYCGVPIPTIHAKAAVIYLCSAYAIIVFSNAAVYFRLRQLKNHAVTISKVHAQIATVFMLEACAPIITVVIPRLLRYANLQDKSMLFKINGIWLKISLPLAPAFYCLLKIFTIKSYRKSVISTFGGRKSEAEILPLAVGNKPPSATKSNLSFIVK